MNCPHCGETIETSTEERCSACDGELANALEQLSLESKGERLQAALEVTITLAGALVIAAHIVNDRMTPANLGGNNDMSRPYWQLVLGTGILLALMLKAVRMGRDARLSLAIVAIVGILPAAGWFILAALGDAIGSGRHVCGPGEDPFPDYAEGIRQCYPSALSNNILSDQVQLLLHGTAVLLLLAAFVFIMIYVVRTRPRKRAAGGFGIGW